MIDITKLPEEEKNIILARRAYARKWRQENAEKIKEHQRRYWTKKAAEISNERSAADEH